MSIAVTPPGIPEAESGPAVELRAGEIGLLDTTVIAVANTAPAYSVSTAIAALGGAVALQMPASMWLGFLPVMGIAAAFYYLNRKHATCGASYAWVGEYLSPSLGFINGWVIVLANVFFLVFAGPQAGQATLLLLNNAGLTSSGPISLAATNVVPATIVGCLWMAFVTFMVYRGVKVAARFQQVLLTLEYFIVLALGILGLVERGGSPFSLSWLSPFSFSSLGTLAAGVVISVFLFWGWDSAVNLSEENENADENPGKAGMMGMIALLGIFLLTTISVQMTLSPQEIAKSGSTTLFVWANKMVGEPLSSVAVLALLSSTVAVLQTGLIPSTRTAYAAGRDGVLPNFFSAIHPRFATPHKATLLFAAVAIAFALIDTRLGGLSAIITAGVTGLGILVAYYYGMTGVTSFVSHRRELLGDWRMLLFAGVIPLLSGLVLFVLGAYLIYSDWTSTTSFAFDASNGKFQVVVPAAILISGVPAMLWSRLVGRADYFTPSRPPASGAAGE